MSLVPVGECNLKSLLNTHNRGLDYPYPSSLQKIDQDNHEMMLSRVFGSGSVYETLEIDSTRHAYNDYPLSDSRLTNGDAAHPGIDSHSDSLLLQHRPGPSSRQSRRNINLIDRAFENTLPDVNEEEGNDDVPGSLLVEDENRRNNVPQTFYQPFDPANDEAMDRLERGVPMSRRQPNRSPNPSAWLGLADPKERAMWKWANVENLDIFLQQVQHRRDNY